MDVLDLPDQVHDQVNEIAPFRLNPHESLNLAGRNQQTRCRDKT